MRRLPTNWRGWLVLALPLACLNPRPDDFPSDTGDGAPAFNGATDGRGAAAGGEPSPTQVPPTVDALTGVEEEADRGSAEPGEALPVAPQPGPGDDADSLAPDAGVVVPEPAPADAGSDAG